jgi:hypothetical protein
MSGLESAKRFKACNGHVHLQGKIRETVAEPEFLAPTVI